MICIWNMYLLLPIDIIIFTYVIRTNIAQKQPNNNKYMILKHYTLYTPMYHTVALFTKLILGILVLYWRILLVNTSSFGLRHLIDQVN